jgi:putative nucleotidyltransferase with HDIG domain
MSTVKLAELIRPNVVYNEEESKRHYEYDYLTLTADRGVIQQGQTIVDKGTIITPQDYTNLQTYEQMIEAQLTKETQSNIVMIIGQFIFVALLLAAMMLYLYSYAPNIYTDRRALIFIFLLITLFFLFASCINSFSTTGVYLVPMTIVPVLILVFFDQRTALFTAIIQTLICAPITTFPLEFIFLQFCAACAAVYSLKELSRRSELLRTSAFVAAAHIVAYFSLELLLNGTLEGFAWMMPVALIINALLVSMTYILMFVVERVFGFTSKVTLIELADINNPLLRQLSNDCPGTFQHCVSVSNIAADAAARIGANEQLVRTGALYHDIGKLSNPAFFTENQHGVNPHDALPPEKSAEIVIRHVTDGLRRADKAGLPAVIKDFISEHHGAGQAKFFYYNYCKQHPEEQHIDPKPFTYPGPNPRTRETSLLMMADAVEAASRSLTEYSNESITSLVNRIIDSQIADGLHNNSTLAYRDVTIIKETFIKRLMTMYHSRVAYPTAPENSTPAQPAAQ